MKYFVFLFLFFSAHSYAGMSALPVVDRIVVFGDSISDTGIMSASTSRIIPAQQNYWQGRFTDGFNWTDFLALSYGTTAADPGFMMNEAIGGATAHKYADPKKILKGVFRFTTFLKQLETITVSSLSDEVAHFKKTNRFTSGDLVIVWMGANDILWVAEKYTKGGDASPDNAATAVGVAVKDFLKSGVKGVLVVGLPDIGNTPRFADSPELQKIKSDQTREYNDKLKKLVNDLRVNNQNVHYLDIERYFNDYIKANSKVFGFKDTTSRTFTGAVVDPSPEAFKAAIPMSIYDNDKNKYIFWDDVHPSAKVHAIIAGLIKKNEINSRFNLNKPKNKCNYVEVKNSGAYVLQVSAAKANPSCGFKGRNLALKQTALFSVEEGANLKLKAVAGRATEVKVTPQDRKFSKIADDVELLASPLQKVECHGTTLIGFKCG